MEGAFRARSALTRPARSRPSFSTCTTQVLHSLSWAMLKEKDSRDAPTIESYFSRAVKLRREAHNDRLAAESCNGLGHFFHQQGKACADADEAFEWWRRSAEQLRQSIDRRMEAAPFSADLAQSLTSLGELQLDTATRAAELEQRGEGDERDLASSPGQAIGTLYEACSL